MLIDGTPPPGSDTTPWIRVHHAWQHGSVNAPGERSGAASDPPRTDSVTTDDESDADATGPASRAA
jgi:hypothetical protein